jgi:aminoglycoside phosphotransferase (APT) family kinase protein
MSYAENPTVEVRQDEALDWARLDECLKSHVQGLSGKPQVSQYPSGNSNLTYRLLYPRHDLVVRRPPFGTRPKSGHSMIREYRVMQALKPVYPAVPTVLFHCADEAVIGAEFYVMDRMPGHLIKRDLPPEWQFSSEQTARLGESFWDHLIKLHQVDYRAIGLADFGKPDGYVERQVLGWNGRFERALTEDVDALADVRQWLADERPESEVATCLVHGDFRIDNMILDHDDPTRIVAVLDWEICALGDPLMDLGNTLAYWIQDDDPEELKQLRMQPSNAPGMLRSDEVLALYGERTGLDTGNFTFYQVYGYFRLAVILQQIYYRYFHQQTKDRRFAGFGQAATALGRHCQRLIDRQ